MAKIKRNRLLLILLFVAIILPVGVTLSKYIANSKNKYLIETNSFYFNSDKLTEDGVSYEINNWSGVGNFEIQFNVNNRKNNVLSATDDITFDLSVDCDVDVMCNLDVTSGIIYVAEKEETITLTVIPNRAFNDNESIVVNVHATSLAPYVKELTASFKVTVGKRGISYEIVDQPNQPYFMFIITNAIDYYTVRTAFGDYALGDVLSIEEYEALSSANQANCSSAVITLGFNPNLVVLDTTSDIMNHSLKNFATINNVPYVNEIIFDIEPTSSNEIRFYKKNPAINYTYPIINNASIINFSARIEEE